ncbi:sulfur carrier protein ThiS adenylyltransferase [Thermotomaculum hydrothermale]|uniref:Sulfur carrier protein ThiS adenylyltransferase n=1 Tax=Thermotomaculum hydrothermale TaxID=981385 RepID=A0A7R6SZG2_9BACT|nr:sulfur carrier protein ThiS adenylyltransferase ThiF [Thermotomaculum hydrothermale]BBB32820.1 sulfur carrier protein ThiS adenylyltransferase [Thermotomaculum hydrothermale]
MKVFLNGKPVEINRAISLKDFLNKYFSDFDNVILNTVLRPDFSTILKEGDRISVFKKGEIPPDISLKDLMFARQPDNYTERLQQSVVGIAGLGGLGSVIGENLVRAGVGKLVVADFDIVEPPNLNRQRYFVHQIGELKVKAFKENMDKISGFTKVEGHILKITRDNVEVFKDCHIVAECFDNPEAKAELVSGIREKFPEKVIVAASGVAGFDSEKTISVKKISDKIYIVGDGVSEVRDGLGLVATRVGVAASIQSHLIVRILLGLEK